MRQALRRDALEQAALLLRRRALARRRPDPAAAARLAARRPQRRAGGRFDAFDIMSMPDTWEYPWFAAWDLAFHCVALAHVDPAFAKYQLIAALPRVVPAPERRAAGLRVGLRRRQPAGAGVGGARGVRDRRRPRHRLPEPDLRQAARQLHLVGEPRGRATGRTSSRAASSGSTTSARSTARTCHRASCWSSPTAPAGWRSTR